VIIQPGRRWAAPGFSQHPPHAGLSLALRLHRVQRRIGTRQQHFGFVALVRRHADADDLVGHAARGGNYG
jgi:hypothetical protein